MLMKIIPLGFNLMYFLVFRQIKQFVLSRQNVSHLDEIQATLQLKTLAMVNKMQWYFFATNLFSISFNLYFYGGN